MELKIYDSPQRLSHRRKNLERVIDDRGVEEVYRLYPEYASTIDEICNDNNNVRINSSAARLLRPAINFISKSSNAVDRMFKFTAAKSKNV